MFCAWVSQARGIILPAYMGRARYNPCNDMMLYVCVPFNWVVIAYDRILLRLRLGRFKYCPHCDKML